MRMKQLIHFILPLLFLFTFISCEKTETFETAAITDYMPTTIGKYITYRLDSTVFTNIGRNIEVHKYQVKHVVDAQVPDNLGRPSFRILRWLRDSAGLQPWVANGTYFITPLDDQAEVIEDNLRFIKIHQPFRLNNNWKGNKYLSTEPYDPRFPFSNDDFMNDWDYTYDQFDATTSINDQNLIDVYTVFHIDEALNAPVTDPFSIGLRTLSLEKYAKGIGLVYRDYVLWEYQPPANGISGFYTGFGIKMWIIDHN